MKQLLLITFGLSIALIAGTSPAETINLNCPQEIKTEQHPKTIPPGWSTSNDAGNLTLEKSHLLTGTGFYDGPPEERALLAPTQTRKHGKNFSNLWKLDSGAGKYWFACNYNQTTVLLTKQLPEKPLHCTAEYAGDSPIPVKSFCTTTEYPTRR